MQNALQTSSSETSARLLLAAENSVRIVLVVNSQISYLIGPKMQLTGYDYVNGMRNAMYVEQNVLTLVALLLIHCTVPN